MLDKSALEPYQELEFKIAEWARVSPDQVAVVNSGTSALHLAIEAYQFPPGSRIIVPDLTMIACARAVEMAGLVPKFVDVDDEGLLDLNAVEEVLRAYRGEIVGVMPVHLYGKVCNPHRLRDIVENFGVYLFEDAAEAHGARLPTVYHGARCWSFYRNKIVRGEEGGAIVFDRIEEAQRARAMRSHNFTPEHNFEHLPRGFNYRMPNAQASLVLQSLAEIDSNLSARFAVWHEYDALVPSSIKGTRAALVEAPWVYEIRFRGNQDRTLMDRIVQELNRRGVAARNFFRPLSSQKEFRYLNGSSKCVVADQLSREGLYLPIEANMTKELVKWHVDELVSVAEEYQLLR